MQSAYVGRILKSGEYDQAMKVAIEQHTALTVYNKSSSAFAVAATGFSAAFEVKGYELEDKSLLDCKLGSGAKVKARGKYANSECEWEEKYVWSKDTGPVDGSWDDRAVDILECVGPVKYSKIPSGAFIKEKRKEFK